jgi:7-cyano-7-deazaguanine synthase in queuosine biosynthesis
VSNDRVILCGGLAAPASARGRPALALDLRQPDGNVTLKLLDISGRMTANMAPVLVDLLEVATYVYCADQASTRGGPTSQDFGAAWRRRFEFHIPVRQPDLWSSKAVRTALCETLGFLSEDEYEFKFTKLRRQQPAAQYLDFSQDAEAGFQAEEVMLFSGGLDSLGGAVHEVLDEKRSVALVSHRSSAKIDAKQQQLVRDLAARSLRKPLHVPVWVNKEKALGREFTQRSRSFLFASLGAVVARLFDLWRIRFYENGVVSINLPISAQVVGGRATRTTHPKVLNGFAEIFSAVFEKPFAVENPFRWKTKAEVVEVIRAGGCGDLVRHAVSCTHVWDMTTLHTHCGKCSQCIDRRFATLAAGCTDKEDPPEMYEVDLVRGERPPGHSRTMLESYVSTAMRVRTMCDLAFFAAFGEAHRVIRHVRGMSSDGAAAAMLDLYRRHAAAVFKVITDSMAAHAPEIATGSVPSSCLLILALPDEYKRPATFAEDAVVPVLSLDEIKDGAASRALLAQIVGHERFEGLIKKIGVRELFFVFLLFGSKRTHNFAGQIITVVPEGEVSQELLKWSGAQHLRFAGQDRDKPSHRVAKMWREFVQQMGKDRKLGELFTDVHRGVTGERLYALRLRPAETQILVASIPALFKSKPASR